MRGIYGSLDTNVLLRLLLNDVPAHHQAAMHLFKTAAGQLVVSDLAIVEVVFVLERNYGYTRGQIGEIIGGLILRPEINCNRPLFRQALQLFVQNSSLSFEDCCLAVYAELNNATPLWTFDQKLAKQAPNTRLLQTR